MATSSEGVAGKEKWEFERECTPQSHIFGYLVANGGAVWEGLGTALLKEVHHWGHWGRLWSFETCVIFSFSFSLPHACNQYISSQLFMLSGFCSFPRDSDLLKP